MTTDAQKAIEALKQLVGTESEPVTYEVERGHVLRFAQAIGDGNPLFTDETQARKTRYGGLIAPPTFLRAFAPKPFRFSAEGPFTRRLDGGSDWRYFGPLRTGDRITVVQRLNEVVQRAGRMGPMLFVVREIQYTNQFTEIVATQRATLISY